MDLDEKSVICTEVFLGFPCPCKQVLHLPSHIDRIFKALVMYSQGDKRSPQSPATLTEVSNSSSVSVGKFSDVTVQ